MHDIVNTSDRTCDDKTLPSFAQGTRNSVRARFGHGSHFFTADRTPLVSHETVRRWGVRPSTYRDDGMSSYLRRTWHACGAAQHSSRELTRGAQRGLPQRTEWIALGCCSYGTRCS